MYDVRYSNSAARYFKKMKDKQLLQIFKQAIDELKADPYIGTQKVGDLRGIYGFDVKYKNANYELAYRIYEGKDPFVVFLLAGTRENFYEDLKRIVKSMRGA